MNTDPDAWRRLPPDAGEPGPWVKTNPAGSRSILVELAPIVDGLCSGCGTKPSRDTGSCRCPFRVDEVIRGRRLAPRCRCGHTHGSGPDGEDAGCSECHDDHDWSAA